MALPPAAADPRIMAAMLKDDPNWPVIAEVAELREEVTRLAARDPFTSGFAEMERRGGGRTATAAHVIGPEHHHSAPEWADRVCYCGEPESPRPAGAAAAEVLERVYALEIAAMTGEPYVPLEGIAEGEPVRGDTATLAAMREGY